MATAAENDAEDVNDFLKRIQELGTKRDLEDEERNRKLEEEILQGRKERQARRAERARSISPQKDSPSSTPASYKRVSTPSATPTTSASSRAVLSPPPDLSSPTLTSTPDQGVDNAMDRLTGSRSRSPTKEHTTPFIGESQEDDEVSGKRPTSNKASPSSAMPSRTSTLSWQRRPTSQSSDRPRSRPLSMIASENAARSPRATPERSPEGEEHPQLTREQIAQSLSSKDPTWFKQTADRGLNSPAYRKNQVEDADVVNHGPPSSRVQMPGMERNQQDSSSSTDMTPSANGGRATSNYTSTTTSSSGIGSPLPQTSAQRFEPPNSAASMNSTESAESVRGLAMSPSQGRISPERTDRPVSPTKGMGGFVQSAMMKRSDSVNKRWSVQSPPGLTRGNSVASNRSSHDTSASISLGGIVNPPNRERPSSSLSRDNSPLPLSRPSSSHSNATIIPDTGRPSTSSSVSGTMTTPTTSTANDSFVKPALPASRSQTIITSESDKDDIKGQRSGVESSPPSSPSKRWSPTKSSWLESALNKPESPKPKPAAAPQQPSWMSEINKAKQRGTSEVSSSSAPTRKHEVKIGGLIRSPPMGGAAKPPSIGGLPAGFSSGNLSRSKTTNEVASLDSTTKGKEVTPKVGNDPRSEASPADPFKSSTSHTPKGSISSTKSPYSPATDRVKPDTPPKKDFRANLKAREAPSGGDSKSEPEFKNVFGQLRRTKTQNYVAPDELKDNILRGKSGLAVTGGPKKTERVDEFKDAILKKKDDFKKAQAEGVGVTRSSSDSKSTSAIPEALAKKAALGKSSAPPVKPQALSNFNARLGENDAPVRDRNVKGSPVPSLLHETSAPGRLEKKEAAGSVLAARFNPALAGLLARGPPSSGSNASQSSNTVSSARNISVSASVAGSESSDGGPQLTHMTKARARGPRRKAPSAVVKSPEAAEEKAVEEPPRALPEPPKSTKTSPVKKDFAVLSRIGSRPSSPTKNDVENADVQPSSPRKLDLKRRSQFLEELPNKNEKTLKQSDSSKSLSPTKNANVDEKPVAGPINTPLTAKPASTLQPNIKSTTDIIPTKVNETRSISSSPGTTRQLTPAPLSPAKMNASRVNNVQTPVQTFQERQPNSRPSSAIPPAIKLAAAAFSQPRNLDATRQVPVKAPIKLPTQDDEDAAMIGAGLHSSDTVPKSKPFSPATPKPKVPIREKEPVASRPLPEPTTPSREKESTVSRPLPSPLKSTLNTPLGTGLKTPSPRKITNPSIPQSTETSKLLTSFFGSQEMPPSYDIDTGAILAAKAEEPSKIRTLHTQVYQLLPSGKKQLVPGHQERILFEGNMYLCTHSFSTAVGKKITEVYFWAGDNVGEATIEDAELFAQREAKAAGVKLIKFRQGQETFEFIEALGGIVIIRRGSSNKYDSLAPHVLCGRRYVGQIVFDEVDFATTSFCSGFPYLVSTQNGKCYLWKGKGSNIDELSCARLMGMDFGLSGDIEEVEDGNESPQFLSIFGEKAKIWKGADHWRLKPNYSKYSTRLFCADSSQRTKVRLSTSIIPLWGQPLTKTPQIQEIAPFTQNSLSPQNIYILDAFFEIYIIVGAASQSQYASFCTALLFAQEYGILAAGMEDRPFVPVTSVVMEGVPRDMRGVFRKWKDAGVANGGVKSGSTGAAEGKGLSRGRSLRVVTLGQALDATRF